MDCVTFARWLEDRDLHDVSEEKKALKHAEECLECQKRLEIDRQLDQLIGQAMEPVELPPSLLHRVDLSLDHIVPERKGRRYRWYGSALVAVAAVVMIVTILFQQPIPSIATMDDFGKYAVNDHQSHDDSVLVVDRMENLNQLEGVVVASTEIEQNLPETARFVGARICPLGECPAVHIVIKENGKRMSVYLVDREDVGFSLVEERQYTMTVGERTVSFWASGDYVFAMVA